PHNGLAHSRNFGIKNSVGKFITFLDSDDEYKRNHLELRMNYFEANHDIDLIHGGVEIIGTPESHYVKDKNDLSKKIHLSDCVIGATLFGRRKVFEALNGFRDIYSEDSDFVERAIEFFNIRKVDFPTYIYHRDTTDSICNTI
ncbi:MAG: glycosyltransferase family 2 protein, partial [Ignavibacteria bacterium]|nr:glycosyltransferase family 2 protein [Ignavibacteria bacterium]